MLPTGREFVNCLKTAGMLTVAHQPAGLTKTEIKAVAFDALRFLIRGLAI